MGGGAGVEPADVLIIGGRARTVHASTVDDRSSKQTS
jgi:hypothetical protein